MHSLHSSHAYEFQEIEEPYSTEHFFGVYLLYCENPKYAGRVYIGYTVNPVRRLKRHNAGKKFGGAWKTSNKGPWKMVLVVYGFPNSTSALRFEWAWQHPQMSRRLRNVPKQKNQQKKFEYSIFVLSAMLQVGPWCRLPLTLRFLDPQFFKGLLSTISPPIHMPISYGEIQSKEVNNNKKIKKNKRKDRMLESKQQETSNIFMCDICYFSLSPADKVNCINSNCNFIAHLICLADEYKTDNMILPINGSCPSCETNFLWGNIIRNKIGGICI